MNCDLDLLVFAKGSDPRVTLFGQGLPYRHGIAEVRPLPGKTFSITIREDAFAEARDAARPFWKKVASWFIPTAFDKP